MKFKSLYPIIVSADPERAIAFYKNFGFEQKHDGITKMGTHVYVVSNGSMEFEIMPQPKNGPFEMPLGMYGMRVNVDDIDEAMVEMQKAGCTIVKEPFETAFGKNMLVCDPDGVNITVIQHIKK